ncbi:UNVERIFIED_CONTAM: hypothetical protein PYX00_001553 [Menopon gallinae]|uniref:Zinc finger protein on ecdysone puffs n=1 Tax=Menopon gallinae TaxID=328185 RepID=A0AAW2IEG1_9NEOP
MDYYYSSSPSMSSRGRFPSRGTSYRGSGRGESSYRGSRGGYSSRGAYSSPRGRGSHYPKYETSSSKYQSETSKYSSHGRMDDSYRKAESSGYGSSRDHSHHRSDVDVGRKRMRSDSYSQPQGTGSRRSHEVDDYRSGGSRYANANSYTESRSYSDNRGEFKKPRVSDYKTKEDYRGRKEISRSSGQVSKTRSFRGRTVRGRGIVRRGGESFLARKRASLSVSRRSASELLSLRRAKILKLKRQRWRERAKLELAGLSPDDKKSRDKEDGDDDDEDDPDKCEEKWDDEKDDDKQADEKEKCKEDGEIDEKAEEKEKEKEKDKEKEKEKEKSKKGDDRIDFFGKPFMKLQCPQCSTKCITFKEYMQHLYRPTHMKAMHERSEQLKVTLAKMRIAQRAKQKKEDEEDVTNMNTRTTFCVICKLNYSHGKSAHQASEAHKKMRNFLLPYCKICHIALKSPMMYERHICTLEHLRRKHALDERLGKSKSSGGDYLDSYMVLDSVGSGDEAEDGKDEKDDESTKKEKEQKANEEDVDLGAEFVHKVEVLYCEVCRIYLPRFIDEKRAMKVHCWTKTHLRCYFRFGNDKLLERIKGKDGKKTSKENEHEKEEKADEEMKKALSQSGKDLENHEEGIEDEAGIDEKLWADVTDLLNQVEPEPKSDDEDEEGGRFDKFKSNEKKENGEVAQVNGDKEAEEAAQEKMTADTSMEVA